MRKPVEPDKLIDDWSIAHSIVRAPKEWIARLRYHAELLDQPVTAFQSCLKGCLIAIDLVVSQQAYHNIPEVPDVPPYPSPAYFLDTKVAVVFLGGGNGFGEQHRVTTELRIFAAGGHEGSGFQPFPRVLARPVRFLLSIAKRLDHPLLPPVPKWLQHPILLPRINILKVSAISLIPVRQSSR